MFKNSSLHRFVLFWNLLCLISHYYSFISLHIGMSTGGYEKEINDRIWTSLAYFINI